MIPRVRPGRDGESAALRRGGTLPAPDTSKELSPSAGGAGSSRRMSAQPGQRPARPHVPPAGASPLNALFADVCLSNEAAVIVIAVVAALWTWSIGLVAGRTKDSLDAIARLSAENAEL